MKCDFNNEEMTCVVCGNKARTKNTIAKCRGAKPSIITKTANFITSAIKHEMKGRPKVSDEVLQERLSICQSCPHYKEETCDLCGCSCNGNKSYMNKLHWEDQSCPIKKW